MRATSSTVGIPFTCASFPTEDCPSAPPELSIRAAPGLALLCATGRVHDLALEDEEQDRDGNGHQHGGGEMQRVLVAGAELPRHEPCDARGERVEVGILAGDHEVRELVPGTLEAEDEERDER